MQVSLTNVRFRCDPNLFLQDLPHDVFVMLCQDIDQSFITQTESVIFSSYSNVEQLKKRNGSYDIHKAVFLLGDKEGWTVRHLVRILMKINNQLALKKILCYWPPQITKRPPVELHLYPGKYTNASVEVCGYPDPQVVWLNPDQSEIQDGNHLQLCGTAQSGQYRVVARSWDPVDGSLCTDTVFFNVISHPPPVPRTASLRPTFEQHWPESAHVPPVTAFPRTHQKMSRLQSPSDALHLPRPGQTSLPGPREMAKSVFGAIGKVALLVGMGTYRSRAYSPLAGPSQDLYELAVSLAQINFRVFTLRDLELCDLCKAIDMYADLLNPGVYGVLYLSGHGVRFPGHGDDFLLPVDAPVDKKIEHCLSRKTVIAQLQRRRPQLNLVIWDACRENARESAAPSVEEASPGDNLIYGESNLFEFRSSVAFTRSYELRRRSLIIGRLLSILGDMSKPINMTDLLTQWKGDVEGSGFQTPAIMLGGSSKLSLWDPIERRSGHTQQFFRILRLWSDGYDLDKKQVFPLLAFQLTNEVNVKYNFLLHNELELQIESKAAGRVLFNLQKVQKALSTCSVHPLGTLEQHGSLKFVDKIRISNLERLVRSSDGAQLTIPYSYIFRSGDRDVECENFLTILHIRLLELFHQKLGNQSL